MAGSDERRRATDKADQEWRVGVHERLEEHERKLGEHAKALEDGRARMNNLDQAIADNTAITKRIDSGVADLVEIFAAFKGFVKVGGWVGTLMKWAAGLLVAIGVIYLAAKTGELPRKMF